MERRSPKNIIHIDFIAFELCFDPRHIWVALESAKTVGNICPHLCQQVQEKFSETSLSLAGKEYVLVASLNALEDSRARFTDLVRKTDSLQKINDDEMGIHYSIVGCKEIYKERDQVLLAVDSFLFEFRSYLELLGRFVHGVLDTIGQAPSKTEKLSSGREVTIVYDGKLKTHTFLHYLCDRLSLDATWYKFLSNHRNFFTHEASPYIALERLSGGFQQDFELIIMRKNIRDFSTAKSSDYFRLSECAAVVDGLKLLARESEKYLTNTLETKSLSEKPR